MFFYLGKNIRCVILQLYFVKKNIFRASSLWLVILSDELDLFITIFNVMVIYKINELSNTCGW